MLRRMSPEYKIGKALSPSSPSFHRNTFFCLLKDAARLEERKGYNANYSAYDRSRLQGLTSKSSNPITENLFLSYKLMPE